MITLDQMILQLKQKGLINSSFESSQLKTDEESHSPWFIRVLLAGSAWIAAILILIFIFGFMQISSKEALLISGAVMCIAGIIFSLSRIKSEFLNQSLLAVSFAGQVLFIIGLVEAIGRDWSAYSELNLYIYVFIFEITLIVLNQNFFHRFVSTILSIIALWFIVYKLKVTGGSDMLIILLLITTIFIWFTETLWICRGWSGFFRPIGHACALSLLFVIVLPSPLGLDILLWGHSSRLEWTTSKIGVIAAALLLAYMILHHYKLEKNIKVLAFVSGSILLIAIPSWQTPGILTAMIVLMLGFYRSNRILIGYALPALAFYLSAYYYNLHATLLMKSIYLVATGAAMLIVRYILLHYFWDGEEVRSNA